ncbi:MAG: hypothetical protein ACRYGK_12530, partial [Janthinobacterium lividum]
MSLSGNDGRRTEVEDGRKRPRVRDAFPCFTEVLPMPATTPIFKPQPLSRTRPGFAHAPIDQQINALNEQVLHHAFDGKETITAPNGSSLLTASVEL